MTLLDTEDHRLGDEALELYRERFGTEGLFENEVFPGIPDLLERLSNLGYVLGVATSKPSVFARRIIEHFDLKRFFESVDGSELDGTRVDKESLIGYLLERDEVHAGDALMIGDRKHDMIGASANAVRGIGVLWGYGSEAELVGAGAELCAENPGQLIRIVEQICSRR